jgi:hypothetical protein
VTESPGRPLPVVTAENEFFWTFAADRRVTADESPAALADIAALFTASPRVVAQEQAGGGHNLSLGLSAMAYHRKSCPSPRNACWPASTPVPRASAQTAARWPRRSR